MTDFLSDWLTDWLNEWLTDWMTDWLNEQQTTLVIDLANRLSEQPTNWLNL